MPAQPAWHARVPEILTVLRDPSAPPFLDRPAFESLFRVGRRQAIRLMELGGGYKVGKTYLVDRHGLIETLENLAPQTGPAVARKQRVESVLAAAAKERQARQVIVPVSTSSNLPSSVSIPRPGRMQIAYSNAAELLGVIAMLATAATDDFANFEQEVERGL